MSNGLVQRGVALHLAGRFDDAEPLYRQALAENPSDAEAWHLLGMLHYQAGRLSEAIEPVERAVRLQPTTARFFANLGIVYRAAGRAAEALASGRDAVRLKPDVAESHNSLGITWQYLARSEDAEPVLAAESPGLAPREQAVACFREATRLQPGYVEAHNNLGHALYALGRTDEALASCRRAIELDPGNVSALTNLAAILHKEGRLGEALALYERALQLQPDDANARWNRSLAWLMAGDFCQGWPEYAWRLKALEEFRGRNFDQPAWDGSSLVGKTLLVWAEQGLGDTLQFIRYAPLVKRGGATVVVECKPALAPLLATCAGVDQVVERGQPLPAHDFQVPLLSLPGIFRTDLANVPADVPYLRADAQRVRAWSSIVTGGELRVGLVWRGSPRHAWDRLRSFSAQEFAALAGVSGVQFYSLQVGPAAAEADRLAASLPLTDLAPRLHDFTETAAALEQLDLLIACDTAVVHLAGALARPVWVALPLSPDWRWLTEREDSPWYPTMRLFRQKTVGDWSEVMLRVRQELERVSATRRQPGGNAPC